MLRRLSFLDSPPRNPQTTPLRLLGTNPRFRHRLCTTQSPSLAPLFVAASLLSGQRQPPRAPARARRLGLDPALFALRWSGSLVVEWCCRCCCDSSFSDASRKVLWILLLLHLQRWREDSSVTATLASPPRLLQLLHARPRLQLNELVKEHCRSLVCLKVSLNPFMAISGSALPRVASHDSVLWVSNTT